MTFDDILIALRTAPLPPTDELNQAVPHADALAPLGSGEVGSGGRQSRTEVTQFIANDQ